LGHPHIVSVKAIITKGTRRYFLFQWADGGSLRDLYQDEERPSLSSNLIKEVVHQLSGLADALHKLHNYQKTESYRHGDLKPENILMFKDNTHVGVWKIADMGLAKRHISATAQRGPTSTRDATPSYEPPEVKTRPNAAWSRLYDIWSMGCVTLEIIVWLLYGHGKLEELNKGIVSSDGHPGPYWLYDQPTKTARVHPTVIAYMEHIKTDPEGRASTAIRDLLRIVEDKLLVVPLSPRSETFRLAPESTTDIDDPQYTGAQHPHIVVTDDSQSRNPVQPPPPEPIFGPSKFRATAEDFCNALRAIEEEGEKDDAYWFTGTKRDGLSSPSLTQHGPQQLLSAPAIEQKVSGSDRHRRKLHEETNTLLENGACLIKLGQLPAWG
ncbi:kinase-like protein, partial [Cryphonectria parasitica EP155]